MNYLIEITQQQLVFIAIEADCKQDAIKLALLQRGEASLPYPPEFVESSIRFVGGSGDS